MPVTKKRRSQSETRQGSQSKYERLEKENKRLRDKIKEFQDNEDLLINDNEKLQQENERVKEVYQNWQKLLLERLDDASQENLKLEDECQELTNQLQQTKNNLTKKTKNLTKTSQKLIKTRSLLKSFQQDSQLWQDNLQELEVSLLEKEQIISQQQGLIVKKQGEINILVDRITNHNCFDSSSTGWTFASENSHVCQTVACSHTDYDQIKQERDQLKTKNTELEQEKVQAIQTKETEIISKIITDLQLATKKDQENALELVINEIKSKLNKDPDNLVDKQIVRELATQTCSHKPTAEIIKKVSRQIKDIKDIKDIKKDCVLTRLESANNYSQLFDIKSEEVKNKLAYEIKQKCYFKQLSLYLGVFSVGSLLVLTILMIKMVKGRKNKTLRRFKK